MKSKILNKMILVSAIFSTALFSGCQEYLDVNTRTDRPSESRMKYTFPSAVAQIAQTAGGRWQMMGGIWAQHWTSEPNAPNYQLVDNYGLTSGGTYIDWSWGDFYTGVLPDLQYVKEQAELEENWNYYLMATVMEAYSYQLLVDLYDQVPYSQALQKEAAPFDNGSAVYDGIIVQLNDALGKFKNGDASILPENDDIVFNGEMTAWVQFANTLKLKIYLRQIYSRPSVASAGITALYAEGAPFLTKDAAFDDYTDELGKENPAFAREWRGGSTNIVASKTLLNYLVGNSDPRLSKIYSTPDGSSTHLGMIQGDYRNSSLQTAKFSECIVTEFQPVYFISLTESIFLQAEAALRGFGGANAKSAYETAVNASFTALGASSPGQVTDAGKYGEFIETASKNEQLETLMVQKWIAFANTQGLEAYFEFNRTGYPRAADAANQTYSETFDPNTYEGGEFLVSVTGTLPSPIYFPKRLLFPSTEVTKNPHTPASQPMYKRVWWDVENKNNSF